MQAPARRPPPYHSQTPAVRRSPAKERHEAANRAIGNLDVTTFGSGYENVRYAVASELDHRRRRSMAADQEVELTPVSSTGSSAPTISATI
jgi:hypothetical protein